jgi:ABC-2 type transport system permease protein
MTTRNYLAAVFALAKKDMRVLTRVKSGMFFTFVWPLIVAILFGTVFGGRGDDTPTAVAIAIVDEDASAASQTFVQKLEQSGDFTVVRAPRADAEAMVRRGQRAAFVVIKPGFGDAARQLFRGQQQFEIGSDPGRQAEGWMIEGLLMKHVMADLQPKLPWTPVKVARAAVERERLGPANGFEITFPQGIVWGILGCVMSFAVGLVSERVHGTYVRLQTAPITRAQILAGKALACFTTISLLQAVLLGIGVFAFGITPSSYALLALACAAASLGFVGFMMMVAGLGRTEQAAGGAGWAMLMPMTLFGGGMMPQFVMPGWMQTVGNVSPVKWAIRGIEGAVWRDFTFTEMLLPCGILLAFGVVCFVIGVRGLRDS